VSAWTASWDDAANRTRHGFDWEMEKLRRRIEATVPEQLAGPKFWRRLIEAAPETPYRRYAGSTYPGSKPGGLDAFRILLNNLLQFALGNESEDGAKVAGWDWRRALEENGPGRFLAAVASGDLQTLVGGPLFLLLTKYHRDLGPVFKLAFGPRSFIVVADPACARHVLRENSDNFDKGLLSEILKPILGQGLIPADPDLWKTRRRAIAPGFHKKWLDQTMATFHECTQVLVGDLDARAAAAAAAAASDDDAAPADSSDERPPRLPLDVADWPRWKKLGFCPSADDVVDMEERLCSTSLDIIGRAVFDYDFKSATEESPLVRAVYRCLAEAERRTTAVVPVWLLPGADFWVPSQRAFAKDLKLLNAKLDELVAEAQSKVGEEDDDDMLHENSRYLASKESREGRISLLDFLVTMRGEDATALQLRDDLMTMLVAGHETTAALLTWTLYELFHPSGASKHHLEALRAEVDAVFDDADDDDDDDALRRVSYHDVTQRLPFARLCLAEGLRLYPQPPLLIRRALDADLLPVGDGEDRNKIRLARGADVFLSTWALHKDPALWEAPESYDPTRFSRPFKPIEGVSPAGWSGYDPALVPPTALYPKEQAADYAFLPFGAGARRCIGDQFAMLESTVMLAHLVRRFDFDFASERPPPPKTGLGGLPVADVGMRTGATIHTEHGLWMRVRKRPLPVSSEDDRGPATSASSEQGEAVPAAPAQ